MNMNENSIYYIAGFVDGEGCIRIKKANVQKNSFYLTLQVTNSNRKCLQIIRDCFGGKIYKQELGLYLIHKMKQTTNSYKNLNIIYKEDF